MIKIIRRCQCVSAALFALASILACHDQIALAGQPDASAPPGLRPTSATLPQIIAAADKAFGPDVAIRTSIETWKVTWSDGVEVDSSASIGDDFAVVSTNAGLTQRYGTNRGKRWEQNENGLTTIMKGIHHHSFADFGLIWRAVKSGQPHLLGEVTSPSESYVVETTSTAGQRMWLYFDKVSGLLDNATIFYVLGQRKYAFSQYRPVQGLMLAELVHASDENGKDTFDISLTSRQYNVPVAQDAVAIPPSRSLVEFPSSIDSVRLPARPIGLYDKYIAIRLTINGRGLDFLLDSGASGIVINRAVATELGLQTIGETEREGGKSVQQQALVPEIEIGSLHMRNVVVATRVVEEQANETTKVVGLLGFDFIAGAILKIDYDHGTVDAYRPDSFVPPQGTTAIDAVLDDNVPMISCQISGNPAENLIIDTGSSDLMIVFSRFANAHFGAAPDPRKNVFYLRYFPLAGGIVPVAEYRPSSIHLGDYYFGQPVVYVTYHVPKFEAQEEDSDGIIGHELLQYFDVYFDYPHSQIYLVPNALYKSIESK